jgi:hypothetical protein
VRFHAALAETQQRRIGDGRFWRVSYEEFCADPGQLVRRVARTIMEKGDADCLPATILPHRCANMRTIDVPTFERLEAAFIDPAQDDKRT